MKILIVDDDRGILNALKVGLTSFGHEVVVAENGNQALNIIEENKSVDLMITDLKMPGMNGLELIRLAKESKPGFMVILITAYGDDSVREEVRNLGSCGYIDKPFRPEDIFKAIRKLDLHDK